MTVNPIPEGYHSVTPYLIIRGAAQALEFYGRALGASEVMRLEHGDKIGHAEIKLGDSHVMLADEFPEMGAVSPQSLGGTPVGICLYVPNVDALFAQAVAAGAIIERPVQDQFYGDRSGTIVDPFGHKWTLATHIEDLTPAQISERMANWSQSQAK